MPPTRPPPPVEPPRARFHFAYVVIAMLGVYVVQTVLTRSQATTTIPYSQFQELLHDGKVKEVLVRDDQILGELKQPLADGNARFVTERVDEKLAGELERYDVTYTQARESTLLPTILSWVLPVALFFGVWVFLMRRMAGKMGPGGNMLAIGKSKAKVYVEAETGVKFEDVAGVDEAKGELREVVDFLRDPARYGRLGGRMPKGVLLVGPPGTGKTLLARAVAGEAKVPFFSISGSEFVEMFVGVGAARVRDLFEQARTKAPCIIFIDELDALGRARSAGSPFGGHDEKEQTLNQLLVEMDGFDSSAGIVLLAATNRPEVLDPALLRAGRFDRQVLVDRPDRIGRAAILRVHARKVKLDAAVELDQVAALTAGFTGADLANLVNEAALAATRRGAGSVELVDFTVAIERIVAGLEKKTRLLVPKERRAVAFHEMGHALVAGSHADTDPVHKVSIIPRGIGALGYTIQRPTEDRFLMTKGELEQKLDVLLGGRAAEDLVFGEVSTGASDDLARATDIARSMVMRYGMLPEIGQVVYDSEPQGFLAQNGAPPRRAYADDTAREIDRAVRQIIDDAFRRARAVLAEHRAVLEDAATALLSQETLTEAELAPYFARVRGSASTPSRTPPT